MASFTLKDLVLSAFGQTYRYVSIVIFLSLLWPQNVFSVKVTMRDGKHYEGTRVEETGTEIIIIKSNQEKVVLPKKDVVQVTYQDYVPKRTDQYFTLGVTIGTPSVINMNLGHMWSTFGVQLSGSYFGNTYGGQLNLGWKIGDSRNFLHFLFIGGGVSQITYKDNGTDVSHRWRYGIIGYNLNWYGLFAEIGIALGSGDYTNPQPAAQLGYVYRFRSDT